MTPTEWMGAAFVAGAVLFWLRERWRDAGRKVITARRYAFDEHVRTAGIPDTDWDAELVRLTGGDR